ncbi:iron-containing alcohol dehydrogenase [Parageobacillus thermoglucosidasius]|uniref:iron-containing alcohol dehydrogenase n=1 Tax=Parageobacillus thermoglucosidasius TaxID=1426 RepID=UPI00025B61DB|nr:iron-containing alcohol dehydrogenase [Parageobacillus thermoglucosidasius]KYD11953.1 Alcohol dehydrogenase [Anoxybacillus flavithermus]REK57081.1 MAG: alcohol dehydrogenase [Geobacillus sp.]EID42699.1 alcohol dehydrogenase, iron-containing [Parageobacillus thermoglucosidasius TNO-09.020]OAO88013.1 Alcohol dehydrogenase [Parageobacillus thermoglucosidasius]GMN99779.1 iron-containing alcohol dehydrogenase [Parageobacillus thermoglucosidasius]
MNIHKFVMPEVIFGNGAIEHAGESCLRLGATNVFIVSDPGVIEAGWLDVVIRSCKQANLQYTVFNDVTMNPKDVEVEKGCKAYIENECDAIIGIGGGSPLDVAKAVAILVTNGGKIHDYEGVNKIRKPLPPQVMIPTTAGSGSEVSQFSVIVDTLGQKKMTIISKSLIPDIAIIDPETLSTKNAHLTASTGLDVLTHGIEAYVSLAATPLTDVQAKNAISLVSEYLRPSVASKINKEAKTKMAMASLQAGLAFSNAILGAVHAMSHAVGGKYPVLHGDINSILLPHVMEYNLLANPKKFADIAAFLGVDIRGLSHMEAGRKAIECIKQLTMEIDAPQRLSDIGLEKDEIPHMSLVALDDACMITNPRDVTAEDIEEIFRRAW